MFSISFIHFSRSPSLHPLTTKSLEPSRKAPKHLKTWLHCNEPQTDWWWLSLHIWYVGKGLHSLFCPLLPPSFHPSLMNYTRWQRSRWTRSTSVSTDTWGRHLQTQKCMQNTSWEQRGVPDQRKRICRHVKLGRMKELGGKTGVLVGLDLPSVGGGTEAGLWSPQQGNCLRQRRNI